MHKLMVTRFNNDTWLENSRWRETTEHIGCIYNAPVHIKDSIPQLIKMYVIEMNNESNQIMGIGRIINRVWADKKYIIYADRNYNRYTYRGKLRINRDQLNTAELDILEKRLFKGNSHIKRGQVVTQVPVDISDKYLSYIDSIFKQHQ